MNEQKYRARTYIVIISLIFISDLAAQSNVKWLIEPYSGFNFTRAKNYYYNEGYQSFYELHFKPSNYTGLAISLERKRWTIGIDKRGQVINQKVVSSLTNDAFTRHYRAYIAVNRLKIEYSIIQQKRWISKLMFSYAIPARSGSILFETIEYDNAGNRNLIGDFWYQRTGAYYGGVSASLRNKSDRFRLGFHLGAERLRNKGISFGEWYNQRDKRNWYYLAGLNFAYTLQRKKD